MSKKKRSFHQKYVEMIKSFPAYISPADKPFAILHRDECDPHHPLGRLGERELCFIWITREKHQHIHDHGRLATEAGWIQPEFRGRPCYVKRTIPFSEASALHWPRHIFDGFFGK